VPKLFREMASNKSKLKTKLTRKQRREAFEKHIPFYLRYMYESYARNRKQIQAKIDSEKERVEYWNNIIIKKRREILEHPQSQHIHAKEMLRMFTLALQEYNRFSDGIGTPEELETFRLFFSDGQTEKQESKKPKTNTRPQYNTAEEMPQKKLVSYD
jgi:hypothetical protein